MLDAPGRPARSPAASAALRSAPATWMRGANGRCTPFPQILADGDVALPLTVKAAAFSVGAKEKIEAAGGKIVDAPQKPKWTRKAHEAAVRAAAKKAGGAPAAKAAAKK